VSSKLEIIMGDVVMEIKKRRKKRVGCLENVEVSGSPYFFLSMHAMILLRLF
jgi:hypothetical protein